MRLFYIFIFISIPCLAATSYFPILQVPQNSLNIGYSVHWSSVSAIRVNPSSGFTEEDCKKHILFSFARLPLKFSSFDSTVLLDRFFFSLSGLFSDEFADYTVDKFYDPQQTGSTIKPFSFQTVFGICPSLFLQKKLISGLLFRFLYEDDGVKKRSGLSMDIGVNLINPFCKAGIAIRNIGILFFRNNGYLPVVLSTGAMKEIFLRRGYGKLVFLLSAETGITMPFKGLAGIHWFYEIQSLYSIGLLLDSSYSLPFCEYDGISPGFFLKYTPKGWKTETFFFYRLRFGFELSHSFAVGFSFM